MLMIVVVARDFGGFKRWVRSMTFWPVKSPSRREIKRNGQHAYCRVDISVVIEKGREKGRARGRGMNAW